MARYEINGQIYEVPDEVQGQQLVETLTMLSEQTAAPSAPAAPEAQEPPPAAPQGQPDPGMAGNLQRAISGERLTPEQLQQPISREPGMVRDALANIGLEAMAAVNRGATGIADFAASLPNAVAQLSGRQEQIPSLTEAASAGTAGGFMEPGLARDVVRGGGELAAPGALAGAGFRAAAQQLPRFGRAGESVLSGTIRQLGQSTPMQDIAFSALSGGGAALGGTTGEAIAGQEGRQVGELAGGLLAPLAGGLRPMRAASDARTPIPRPTTAAEDEAIAATQATGVEAFPAQRTLDPQQLRAQRFLPELTPATERAAESLSRQNRQASAAVDDFVRAIAPDDAVVTAAGRFRNASQRAIEAQKDIRAQKASPLYQKAFDEFDKPQQIDGIKEGGPDSVTVFHGTSEDAASSIKSSGRIEGPAFFTPRRNIAEEFADGGEVLEVKIPRSELKVDLDLPGARLLDPDEAARALDLEENLDIDDFIERGFSVGTERPVIISDIADTGRSIDIDPVLTQSRRVLHEFPESGSVSKSIQRVINMIGSDPSLKRLHNVKLEIDDMLTKVGDGSLGNTAKRELRNIKQALVDQMEAASPAYREARLTFEAESPAVTQLEESIIGKIADIDDTQLKNVSRRIFDPAETNPTVVRRAKAVIDEVDPDAWNRLVRAEIERRIGSIRPEVGTSFENIPGKLNRAIFGTGKQRDALMSGLSGEERRNAELLETALTRASLGRPGGSETAGRQQFIRELDTGVVSTVRNFLREPIDRAIGIGESAAFDRRAKALADALFDPAWSGEAREAFKDRSGKSFGFLLYRINDLLRDQQESEEQESEQRQQAPVPPASTAQQELRAQ